MKELIKLVVFVPEKMLMRYAMRLARQEPAELVSTHSVVTQLKVSEDLCQMIVQIHISGQLVRWS